MNKRFLEIMNLVVSEMRENSLGDLDMQALYDILVEEGFSEEEISLAMAWLLNNEDDLPNLPATARDLMPRPIWRKLNEVERDAISPKAFSYLFHLRELDILTDDSMEKVIDRAVNLRLDSMNVDDMKDLIAAVVLDFEESASKGYFQFTTTRSRH